MNESLSIKTTRLPFGRNLEASNKNELQLYFFKYDVFPYNRLKDVP